MKKTLFIAGIIIGVFLLALIVLPLAFKGKIEELVKKEANEMLNAKIDFENVDLSFIAHFPNAAISVNGFSIVGTGEFEGDTLAYLPKATAVVNLASIFGDDGYEVKKIAVYSPSVLAKVLPNGKVNWDIMKPDSTATDTVSTTAFKLQLKKVTVENARIVYDDRQTDMRAELNKLDLKLSGDMTESLTKLAINADVKELSFFMDKIPYLNKAQFTADVNLDADLNAMKFTLTDNTFNLNAIEMNLDGWLTMLDEGYDMDLKLNTPKVDFKSILSLVPAIYAKDFGSIKTDGKVSLEGFAKGQYTEKTLPAFDVKLLVSDAWFQYPDFPKRVEGINMNVEAQNPDGNLENTQIIVREFRFVIGNNPFQFTATVIGMTNPAFNFSAKGRFDLGAVKDFYPLDKGMSLSGLLTADLNGAGRMSYVEKEQYDKLLFGGTFSLADMKLKTAELKDEVQIKTAQLTFNPQTVAMNTAVVIGKNDLSASGSLSNFLGYVLKDQTLRGKLAVNSGYLNISDFMPETATTESSASDTLSVIEVPKNIDFTATADFKKIVYDKIELTDSKGGLTVKNGVVTLNNLQTNAFDGTMTMSGSYSTADIKNPTVNMTLGLKNIAFKKLFTQVETIQKLAPIFENMGGTFSTDLKFSSPLGADMMPVLNKIVANGLLSSSNFSVSGVTALDAVATALKNESLKTIKANDLKINFAVADGRVSTKPFDIKMGNTSMNLSGSTGLDQTIDYTAKVALPNSLTAGLPINVGVKIGGTFTKPQIKLDGSGLVDSAKDLAKEKIGEQVDAAKSKANEELQKLIAQAEAQKAKLVAEAQKTGQKLRDEAKTTGDKLVAEAQKQADKMVSETSNPLAKAAAQTASKKLVDEAQKKADALNAKADDSANKLETAAQTEGDKLIQAAKDNGTVK